MRIRGAVSLLAVVESDRRALVFFLELQQSRVAGSTLLTRRESRCPTVNIAETLRRSNLAVDIKCVSWGCKDLPLQSATFDALHGVERAANRKSFQMVKQSIDNHVDGKNQTTCLA